MVAEAIPAPTDSQAPSGETPEPTSLPEATGADAAPPPQAEEASLPDSTGSEEAFNVADLPEWQEAVSQQAAEAPPPSLPGEDLATVTARAHQGRALQYARILESGETAAVQTLREFGLSDTEATQVWQRVIQPLANALHGNNTDYQAYRLNTAVALALKDQPELQKAFFERRYNDEVQFTQALIALGEKKKDAEFKADLKSGKYVTKAQAEKIAAAAFNKGRGLAEKNGVPGARSGNSVNGTGPGGVPSLAAWQAMTLEQREAARRADPMIEIKIAQASA